MHCHNWMQNKANINILDISLKEDKVSFIDSSQQENITFQPLHYGKVEKKAKKCATLKTFFSMDDDAKGTKV